MALTLDQAIDKVFEMHENGVTEDDIGAWVKAQPNVDEIDQYFEDLVGELREKPPEPNSDR
jgi:hypothetical protein